MQEVAAGALKALAWGSQPNKDAFMTALTGLVATLGSTYKGGQQHAAGALWNLVTGSQHNKDAIIAAGAVLALTTLLRSTHPEVKQCTIAALKALSSGFSSISS